MGGRHKSTGLSKNDADNVFHFHFILTKSFLNKT